MNSEPPLQWLRRIRATATRAGQRLPARITVRLPFAPYHFTIRAAFFVTKPDSLENALIVLELRMVLDDSQPNEETSLVATDIPRHSPE